MDTRPQQPTISANPPSVEIAYKRKCIALKKRLAEIEVENEIMRTRNRRGWQYIQKMRLESCMLLERLARVTGMTKEVDADQSGADEETRARYEKMMRRFSGLGGAFFEDESEESSEEQPPTPEERPLRVKRSRKSNVNLDTGAEEEPTPQENAAEPADRDAALPRLAPAPSQQDLTSTFRVQTGSNGSPREGANTPANGEARDGRSEVGKEENRASADAGTATGTGNDGTTPMDMDVKEPKVEG